jgi:arginase
MTPRFLLTPYSLDQLVPELRRLMRDGWALNEPVLGDDSVLGRIASLNQRIATFTEGMVRDGNLAVCVTGDCCAAIGAITGLQRGQVAPRLLWLDAHGDFNTPETTPSGFIGGMPLAMLTGRGDQTVLERLGTRRLADRAVVLCDARDLDPLEREALAASEVIRLPSVESLARFDFGSGPLHIHFDPDILNPVVAPAMAYATPGGPSVEALSETLSGIVRRVPVVSITLTTWAVDRDESGATAAAVLGVLDALL